MMSVVVGNGKTFQEIKHLKLSHIKHQKVMMNLLVIIIYVGNLLHKYESIDQVLCKIY